MGHVIVIEFITLDGIVDDPDGADHTAGGGWAFRHGPAAIAGDKFALGESLDRGTMLLGRATWQKFAQIWPNRADDFAARMNAVPKVVAAHAATDLRGWTNSRRLDTSPVDAVKTLTRTDDVIVAGSLSVVRALAAHDLVDEYRLLTFPTVVGAGTRLFPDGEPVTQFDLAGVVHAGPASLATYVRSRP